MNRIDTIKGSVKEADKMRAEIGELSELDELYLADIQYLLSKLEIAEKALEGVVNVIEVRSDHINADDQQKWDEALLYKVNQSLKQLRE